MKLLSTLSAAVALTAVVSAAEVPLTAASAQDQEVTIVGCAVKGTDDGDGFLLANTTPSNPTRILYWLDDDDDEVEKLMGQLVEITGKVEGDIKRGEIEVERENGMIELEIKAGDRKANVKLADVPAAIGTAGSVKDREKELPYVVRKLDVKSAKSIAATCK